MSLDLAPASDSAPASTDSQAVNPRPFEPCQGDPASAAVSPSKPATANHPWAQDLVQRFGAAIDSGVRHVLTAWGSIEDRELIPDLVQETYCRLLEDGGRRLLPLQNASDLKCRRWLRRVAERVALDHLRGRNCIKRGAGIHFDRVENYVGYIADLREGPEEVLMRRDEMRALMAACRRVTNSESNARLVAMALSGGWSSGQLARLREIPITRTGIDSLLSRSRRRLAREGFPLPLRYAM